MCISIIHPSRSRPTQAAATAKAWLSSAKDRNRVEYILSVDEYDPSLSKYIDMHIGHECHFTMLISDNNSAIQAINEAAEVCKGSLLLVVSDDFNQPPFHWDEYLIQALRGKSDFVVKTQDGAQPWIITLPIMDRVYYERFGYVYHPEYRHMFADTEMTHVAHMLGKVIDVDMKIPHNHYTTGKVKRDDINKKNDATWAQGEKLYLERLMRNFDLPDDKIVSNGNFDAGHKRWLLSKGITYDKISKGN